MEFMGVLTGSKIYNKNVYIEVEFFAATDEKMLSFPFKPDCPNV